MDQAAVVQPYRASLPVILVTAVIQGWALYALQHAIMAHSWPATRPGWLFGLYAVAVLIPVTLELLADHARDKATWVIAGAMAVMLFYFGWHHGRSVADTAAQGFALSGRGFPLALVLGIFWLHALPFVQARLAAGRWTAQYAYLFTYSWRNAVSLAEALAFTGCFWLLLSLWQTLFRMLGMEFFHELFGKPIFIYPVTSIVFGTAVHLIGSIDRVVSTVLEQILNVFKWLGVVTGALLALFTVALVIKLPGLLFTGHHAIGAAMLLWLVAVVVLFLNAAYRDGTSVRPYPKWLALSLRLVVPLTTVVTLTACYALYVRAQHYGLTVERVWAFIVAGAALIYSVGYALAAFNRGAWFGGMARVNVLVALCLVAVLGLALTPVLSPYRLAADSQYHQVLAGHFETDLSPSGITSSFHYLRFDSGVYGRDRLEQLSRRQRGADAARIRELASAALRASGPWQAMPTQSSADLISQLRVFPAGRTLDAALSRRLRADLQDAQGAAGCRPRPGQQLVGFFIDLDGDGIDEFIVWNPCLGTLYQRRQDIWLPIGTLVGPTVIEGRALELQLSKGEVTTTKPHWQELWIGKQRLWVAPK